MQTLIMMHGPARQIIGPQKNGDDNDAAIYSPF